MRETLEKRVDFILYQTYSKSLQNRIKQAGKQIGRNMEK